MAERVAIFDTTLRDGEQSPGASMNAHEKIQMALQLERLGVDVIEAGFPIASQQEFESVQQIAATVQKPGVAALARAAQEIGETPEYARCLDLLDDCDPAARAALGLV